MSIVNDTCQGRHFLGVGCKAHTTNTTFCENAFASSVQQNRVLKGGASKAHPKQCEVIVYHCLGPIAQFQG